MSKSLKAGDRKFKEIRRELNRKQQAKKNENVVHEYYVDHSRMISVELGGEGDLKNQMQENIKKWGGDFNLSGEYHDYNIVKLAEHYMKKGNYKSALEVLMEILQSSHPSISAKVAFSRCHLLMGDWENALEAAEIVLDEDKRNIKAIFVKAEALFNICEFEHSLVLFHRGLTLAPDMDDFRLGVQKCRKTIDDGVGNPGIFQVDGLEMLFKMLRVAAVTKEVRAPGPGEEPEEKSCKMGLVNLTSFVGDQSSKSKSTIDSIFSATKETSKQNGRKNVVRSKSAKSKLQSDRAACWKMKSKTPAKIDRLSEDKEYLSVLANGIGRRLDIQDDGTNKMVQATANQALDFLKARENFWDQLDLGQDHRKAKASSLRALQSYRWIM